MMKDYFTLKEMECPCCHEVKFDEAFHEMLNKARDVAGVPFIISSGYRCKKHNTEVGGVESSAHRKGCGCDIKCCGSLNRFKIVLALLNVGFKRIGIGKTFIHCDTDSTLPQGVLFDYYK